MPGSWNKINYCNKGCGQRLKWDPSQKSASGKQIPLDYETGKKHDCPNDPYNQKNKTTEPLPPNYGNLYSGNELTDQKVSYKQSQDAVTEAQKIQSAENMARMEGIQEEMLLCLQELTTIAKDIRGLILQKQNPEPKIFNASEMKKPIEIHDELGLSDHDVSPEDNDIEDEAHTELDQ
jgi:hypothetical protein